MKQRGLRSQLDNGSPCLNAGPATCTQCRCNQQPRGLGKMPFQNLRDVNDGLSVYLPAGSGAKFIEATHEIWDVEFPVKSGAGNDDTDGQRVVREGGNDEGVGQGAAEGRLVAS